MSDEPDDNRKPRATSLWPIGFAIGIACILVGLVISWPAVVLGAALTIVFGLLWIRDTARSHAPGRLGRGARARRRHAVGRRGPPRRSSTSRRTAAPGF